MWLKLAGMLLVVGSSSAAGLTLSGQLQRRPRLLAELQKGLQALETQIVYGVVPLNEAFLHCGAINQGAVGELFQLAAARMKGNWGKTGGEIWQEEVVEWGRCQPLTPADIRILASLGGSLGNSDRLDQAKHLELVRQQLARQEEEARAAASRYSRPVSYLGLLGGLALTILLL